jgi:hypothetical protein
MARPVDPLDFLFQPFNVFGMYKISGYYSISVVDLFNYEQAKSFSRLILKVIGNFVNMMV